MPLLPSLLKPGVVAPDRVLSIAKIELTCVLMLNWIAWYRTALTFKLRTYARPNCLKENCLSKTLLFQAIPFSQLNLVLMLNWIVWNKTVYLYKMDLALNNLQRLICHKTQTQISKQTVSLNYMTSFRNKKISFIPR